MIAFLSDRRMTIKEMSERFDISERTAYRYIDLFEAVGYCIDRDFHGNFFIFAGPIIRTTEQRQQESEPSQVTLSSTEYAKEYYDR